MSDLLSFYFSVFGRMSSVVFVLIIGRFRVSRWRQFWTHDITFSCVIWCHAFNLKFSRRKQTWEHGFWGWPLTCSHDLIFRRSRSGKRLFWISLILFRKAYAHSNFENFARTYMYALSLLGLAGKRVTWFNGFNPEPYGHVKLSFFSVTT